MSLPVRSKVSLGLGSAGYRDSKLTVKKVGANVQEKHTKWRTGQIDPMAERCVTGSAACRRRRATVVCYIYSFKLKAHEKFKLSQSISFCITTFPPITHNLNIWSECANDISPILKLL